jgi:hypothetical protein
MSVVTAKPNAVTVFRCSRSFSLARQYNLGTTLSEKYLRFGIWYLGHNLLIKCLKPSDSTKLKGSDSVQIILVMALWIACAFGLLMSNFFVLFRNVCKVGCMTVVSLLSVVRVTELVLATDGNDNKDILSS